MSSCGSTVTHRQIIPFSKGKVELVVISVGGALGEERYRLSFDNGGKQQEFFRGTNFSEFNVSERGSKLLIQMCHGGIDRAEPIGIGELEGFRIVRLDLDWNCKDKSND